MIVLFLLGFLIGRGHTGGSDDGSDDYDDEPRTPAKPLLPQERETARVPRLVPREELDGSDPSPVPDKTPAAPVTPPAPAEEPAPQPKERSAVDEPTQADEDEVRTMSLEDLLDDIHNM